MATFLAGIDNGTFTFGNSVSSQVLADQLSPLIIAYLGIEQLGIGSRDRPPDRPSASG